MQHATRTPKPATPTSQAALTAFALERIAAQLFATLDALPVAERAKVEEAAVEIYAHSDALLVASTEPTLERIRNAAAR